MAVIRLICWKPESADEHARALEAAGFRVDASPLDTGRVIGVFRANPPTVTVIDLDRLPSHGREVGIALRNSKSTRLIPLVFAGGPPEKVQRIREELPDAFYTDWESAPAAIKKAIKHAPANPVKRPAHMERYAASTLVRKLGFAPDMHVALLNAPEGFTEMLGELPAGVLLQERITARSRMALWFVRTRHELEAEAEFVGARLPQGCSLWIASPKQTGRYKVDFNQNDVRQAGLAVGLVDYKVCAVDADWSGLKFARKKT